ncbi:N-alpha-acetyltransferase auxiliary subunit [Brachionus plicatilis]|uniref:N-alpha-acetyltransferase auxiliary subunit n=1 Tax=Brachionus plicatilis TaxID=10195 RepID=A0A3M7PV33_BRAPC|nr:N-alpha-acetyltransferase auxiliary subunit [Brachionus plicatilis]
MSVHIGYDLWKKFKHESLLHLVAKLKMGLKNSPTNFQIKLLLLNLYSHLGAYDSIKIMYDSMDIKNIQYYSTSNLLIFNNIRLGSFESSAQVHSTMDTFFNSGLFDLTSFMVNCYKYGTFLKAFEINSFIDELKKSLTVHMCLTNHVIQQIVMDQVNIKEHDASETDLSTGLALMETKIEQYFKNLNQLSNLVDKNEFFSEQNSLVDHSDTNVVYDWSPPNQQQKTSQNRLGLIEEQKKLLKLRILWIKFIYLNIKNQFSDEKFALIKSQLANFDYGKQEPSDLEIFNSKSNYLKEFLKLNLDKIVTNFVHLIADMALGEDFLANDSQVQNYRNTFKKLFENFELEAPDANTESLSAVLESLSAVVETLSIFIVNLVSVLGNEFYKPIWTEKCKKSKKKKGVYLKYAQTVDMLFEIYEFLFDALNKLLNNFDKFKLSASFVDGLIQKIDDQSVDFSDLTQSYRKSFEELRKIYSAKVKFLLKFSQNSVLKP